MMMQGLKETLNTIVIRILQHWVIKNMTSLASIVFSEVSAKIRMHVTLFIAQYLN